MSTEAEYKKKIQQNINFFKFVEENQINLNNANIKNPMVTIPNLKASAANGDAF